MSYMNDTENYDESAYDGEWDEASRKRRPRSRWRMNAARPRPYITRPSPSPVAQVSTAFDRVGSDVRSLRAQGEDIEDKVDASSKNLYRAVAAVRNDLQQTKMLTALLPLLSRPQSKEVADDLRSDNGTLVFAKGEKVVKASDDTLTTLLPLLLIGMSPPSPTGNGAPDGSGGGYGGFGGDSNGSMMMMVVLALALTNKN
jgi:hypothetical protein